MARTTAALVRTMTALQVTTSGRQDAAAHAHLDDGSGKRGGSGQRTRAAKGYRVVSIFDSPADEHYYGLGQQQKGWMDLRDHEIRCWHDYTAIGGEDVCVPFMVSSRGYGLVWDNPSKTTVDLGFNGRNVWSSEVGDRVSYFVIAGQTSDEIYAGLPSADRRNAHAAEGDLRIHPEQGDLSNAGTGSRCGEGVSPEESAARRDGRGLPEHDEAR